MTFPDFFLTEIKYRYKQVDEIITNGELYWNHVSFGDPDSIVIILVK